MLAYRATAVIFDGLTFKVLVPDPEVPTLISVENPEAAKHVLSSPGQAVTEYATVYERASAWLRRNKPEISTRLEPALAMLRLYTPQSTITVFETALQQIEPERASYVPPSSRFDEQVLDDLRLLWAADKPVAERYLELWNACVPEVMDDTTWVAIFGHAGHYKPLAASERMMNYKFQNFVGWYLNQIRTEKRRNGT